MIYGMVWYRLQSLEPYIAGETQRAIDRIITANTANVNVNAINNQPQYHVFDFVERIANPLPLKVIMMVMIVIMMSSSNVHCDAHCSFNRLLYI
jgi:cytochrome P450